MPTVWKSWEPQSSGVLTACAGLASAFAASFYVVSDMVYFVG